MSKKSGFTLIEVLIGSAILVIFFAAITAMVQMSLRVVGQARVSSTARHIIQDRMETIRNMPYIDVGTEGGIPSGILLQEEILNLNGQDFVITTDIIYVDDPFDDVAPTDTNPIDYKRVRVSITWDGIFSPREPLVLITDLASKGIELEDTGGTLIIQVLDSQGDPVTAAQVHVYNDSVIPTVDLNTYTDSDGLIELPGSAACLECYQITTTQTGFTTDRTYGTEEVANPHQPHASIIEGDVTQLSFVIDSTSNITFKTVKPGTYGGIKNVRLLYHGSKEIGRDTDDNPVYKFDGEVITDAIGQKTVYNLDWDTYTVTLPGGTLLDFAGSWPISPFSVLPGAPITYTAVIESASDQDYLVITLDNTGDPVGAADITLKNELESYLATQSTALDGLPDRGQTYFNAFPDTVEPFEITIEALGFDTVISESTLSGEIIEQFILSPE